jgi:mannose-1-phosphate guanylyltransferase
MMTLDTDTPDRHTSVIPPWSAEPQEHSTVSTHLWGIVLDGCDGTQLQPFIRADLDGERPKHYCTCVGTHPLLRQTLQRAEQLILSQRLLTVLTQAHLPYAQAELTNCPSHTTVVQPSNRGTGPGLLLPLFHVLQRDTDAIVAVFPADHFLVEDARLMAAVASAAAWVARTPSQAVLLGVSPTRLEVQYDWIVPGEVVGQSQGKRLYQVQHLWEKPPQAQVKRLLRDGALWNTSILVGMARLLLALYRVMIPELVTEFDRVRHELGSPEEADLLAQVYIRIAAVNFSQTVLVPNIPRLVMLPV